jgi:PhnB protein
MARIDAYLRFDGNCRQAMTFYKECLGGELDLQSVGESAMAGQMPPETHKRIMHSTLRKGDLVLLGSDMMEDGGAKKGNTVTLALNCSSEEEINRFYRKLSAGGKETYPLKTEFWGATFGQLTDKFGIDWMLNYDKNAKE